MRTLLRRLFALLGGFTLAMGAIALTADTASADHIWPTFDSKPVEQNNGVRSSAPSSPTACVNHDIVDNAARVCWVANGDVWYVQDTRSDGRSALGIWEDWACNDSGSFPCNDLYRQGICRNPHGAGTWARCNKDYYESHAIYFKAGPGEGFHVLDYTPLWVACRPHTSCR